MNQRQQHEKHGLTYLSFNPKIKRPEYYIWDAMKQRCLNPKHKSYKNYGGRGISICESWEKSFANFYKEMGDRPSPLHSLDRKENDKGYYKQNCRWVLKEVQNNNTRSNVFIEFKGDKHTVSEWAKIKNIGMNVLWERIKAGWDIEKALTQPLSKTGVTNIYFKGYYITPFGKFTSREQAAKAEKVDPNIIKQRVASKNKKWAAYTFEEV